MRKLLSILLGGLLIPLMALIANAEPPNVLMIVIDDLNDWVGPLGGHPQVQTPTIDSLAAKGVNFTNAHCQAPLCNASRTSFLLSRRPSSTGVYALNPYFRSIKELSNEKTVLQHFHDSGYETYCVGKVFHGANVVKKLGLQKFEADHFGPGQDSQPMRTPKLSGTHPIDGKIVDWGIVNHAMSERCDHKTTQWAIDHLERRKSRKPFFMACGYYLPHVPIYTTKVWHDLYPVETLQLPEIEKGDRADCSPFAWNFIYRDPYPKTDWLEANEQLVPLVRSYLAAISFTDSEVARLLEALNKSGAADNTIVVLFSDHGFHCGEKGISGKHSLWEESTRVPLIFTGPQIQGGRHCSEAVELLDVYPTLAELAGLRIPESTEGLSLLPQIRNVSSKREQPAICTNSPHNHTVRDERWRLIQYADGSREFYDCENDPGEHHNLIGHAGYVDIVKRMEAWLPQRNVAPVKGSLSKMVAKRDGRWYYENTLIED